MSVPPINSLSTGLIGEPAGTPGAAVRTEAADRQRVAEQFEAILVRQFIGPALESAMSGGGQAGGGGTYSYLLTDVLASKLTAGRGLGLAPMIAQQLTPRGTPADLTETP